MNIYHYDQITGEYTGVSEAKLDPLELEINKQEIYLLPAFATFDKPPDIEDGKKIIMVRGAWLLVEIPQIVIEPIIETIITDEELAKQELEILIQSKIREQAIAALTAEGKITPDGKIATLKLESN